MSKLLCLTCLLVMFSFAPLGHLPLPQGERKRIAINAQSPEQQIRKVLSNRGVSDATAELIVAQAKLESGHFQSSVYNQTNNPFGMRPARVRKHLVCGQYRGYAVYESLSHAVEDYLLWMEFVCIPLHIADPATFVRFLESRGYFEASAYEYLRQIRGLLASSAKDENFA